MGHHPAPAPSTEVPPTPARHYLIARPNSGAGPGSGHGPLPVGRRLLRQPPDVGVVRCLWSSGHGGTSSAASGTPCGGKPPERVEAEPACPCSGTRRADALSRCPEARGGERHGDHRLRRADRGSSLQRPPAETSRSAGRQRSSSPPHGCRPVRKQTFLRGGSGRALRPPLAGFAPTLKGARPREAHRDPDTANGRPGYGSSRTCPKPPERSRKPSAAASPEPNSAAIPASTATHASTSPWTRQPRRPRPHLAGRQPDLRPRRSPLRRDLSPDVTRQRSAQSATG